jgi:hypothetical protein
MDVDVVGVRLGQRRPLFGGVASPLDAAPTVPRHTVTFGAR